MGENILVTFAACFIHLKSPLHYNNLFSDLKRYFHTKKRFQIKHKTAVSSQDILILVKFDHWISNYFSKRRTISLNFMYQSWYIIFKWSLSDKKITRYLWKCNYNVRYNALTHQKLLFYWENTYINGVFSLKFDSNSTKIINSIEWKKKPNNPNKNKIK